MEVSRGQEWEWITPVLHAVGKWRILVQRKQSSEITSTGILPVFIVLFKNSRGISNPSPLCCLNGCSDVENTGKVVDKCVEEWISVVFSLRNQLLWMHWALFVSKYLGFNFLTLIHSKISLKYQGKNGVLLRQDDFVKTCWQTALTFHK